MRILPRRTLLTAVLLAIAGAGFTQNTQDKVVLTHRATPGQVYHRKSTSTVRLDSGGQTVRVEAVRTDKFSVTEVSPTGDITMTMERESLETTVNGLKTTGDLSKEGKRTVIIHPDGTLTAYKLTDAPAKKPAEKPAATPAKAEAKEKPAAAATEKSKADAAKTADDSEKAKADAEKAKAEADKAKEDAEKAEAVKAEARLYAISEPVFPAEAVGVGDKWSRDYPADAEMGTQAAHADFEVAGFDKVGDTETVRIRVTYRETGPAPAITATGTLWIDKALGNLVVADADVENVPFRMGAQTPTVVANVRTERVDGKKDKRIAEIVKDYDTIPGLVKLYRKKEDGKDTIYAELRADQLNKLMMMEVTASTGTSGSGIVAGDPINDLVFQFNRTDDDRIVMVAPNIAFRAKEDTPIARAVRRSFADGYLQSFKIEAEDKVAKTVLINVSDLFKGDISGLGMAFSMAGGYSLDREKTYLTKLSNFPENLVVETQYHFTKGGVSSSLSMLLGGMALPDPRSAPVRVSYNLFPLPDSGYRPRLADGRIGYFTTDYQDFDRDDQHDPMIHYILRWNLEKADPKLALSPPKKPIVFWVDNAIPQEYRGAVREGILLWNKAFERIGIKDAIEVKQMPDDADWDHADMRYNTIRWVASQDGAYAVALFRSNPITGEILNANITVDSNLTRYEKIERKDIVEPSVAFEAGAGVEGTDLSTLPKQGDSSGALDFRAPVDPADPRACAYATGMVQQAWFGHLALSMLGDAGVVDGRFGEEQFVHSFIRQTVCHEFGHILGLRHNFIASTEFSLADLKNPKTVRQHGLTSSVMDYTPFNISALRAPGVDFFAPAIGDYDRWAIQYGYVPVQAKSSEGEVPALKKIARESGLPGHAYQSDEIADQFDPLVTRFDLGSDPLDYYARMVRVSRYLLVHLDQRLPKKGESYYEFTRAFNRLLNTYANAAGMASRYIGGLNVNRNYKGDVGEKPTLMPVPAAKQREALDLLNTYIFSPGAFAIPPRYYTKLTTNPQAGLLELYLGSSGDFPIYNQISSVQASALRRLFAPAVLNRVANNEFKEADPKTAFTMPYLFHSVSATVWSELGTKSNIPSLRRQLQRAHLDTMISMAVGSSYGVPADARMLAWDELRALKGRLSTARAGRHYDDYTRIHLDESLARVNRALAARFVTSQAS